MTKLKEIELPYTRGRLNRVLGNYFTIAFVYPQPPYEPFVIKAGIKDVTMYLDKNLPLTPAVVHKIIFTKKGKRNTFCSLHNMGTLRIRRERPNRYTWNRRYYYIIDLSKSNLLHILELRKIPRCWIKELDPYVPKRLKKYPTFSKEKSLDEWDKYDDLWTGMKKWL